MYDRLFLTPSPGKLQPDGDFLLDLNPDSVKVLPNGYAEPSIAGAVPGDVFQFERVGYFCVDESSVKGGGRLVFNRVVTLKDNWASKQSADAGGGNVPPPTADDVLRVEMRVGRVLSAEKHPDADTLLVETVDCGEAGVRTVVSGIAKHYSTEALVNRLVLVVCNLKPAKMRGVLSEGMLLAASKEADGAEQVELVSPPIGSEVGELVRVEGLGAPAPDPVMKSKTAQDMYKRVSALFSTNAAGEVVYGDRRFVVSKGVVTGLGGAVVR